EELKKLSGPLVRDLDRIERTLKQTREVQRPDDPSICPDCFHRRKEHDSVCLQCGHRFED
ncbi:MAG: hypothetical protein KDK37_15870, partial [Leptospiraceae bacterium]|nr:hypothetical protein [Leptospiraceae bacterium]